MLSVLDAEAAVARTVLLGHFRKNIQHVRVAPITDGMNRDR